MYSIEEMIQRADTILVGTVESILHSPTLNNVPYMHRQVQVSVYVYLKHFMNSTNVIVIVEGATFGNKGYGHSSIAPEFEEPEKVLLFLKEGVNGFFEVLAGYQGKFAIENDTAISESGRVIEDGLRIGEIKFNLGERSIFENLVFPVVVALLSLGVIYLFYRSRVSS